MITSIKSPKVKRISGRVSRKSPYRHITSNPGILSGVPIIEGTRVPVRIIAGYYQLGMSVDEILLALNHLKPSEVHSALAYYFDHKKEIDNDIKQNRNTLKWKKLAHSKK